VLSEVTATARHLDRKQVANGPVPGRLSAALHGEQVRKISRIGLWSA
jgi:hypothetical protein